MITNTGYVVPPGISPYTGSPWVEQQYNQDPNLKTWMQGFAPDASVTDAQYQALGFTGLGYGAYRDPSTGYIATTGQATNAGLSDTGPRQANGYTAQGQAINAAIYGAPASAYEVRPYRALGPPTTVGPDVPLSPELQAQQTLMQQQRALIPAGTPGAFDSYGNFAGAWSADLGSYQWNAPGTLPSDGYAGAPQIYNSKMFGTGQTPPSIGPLGSSGGNLGSLGTPASTAAQNTQSGTSAAQNTQSSTVQKPLMGVPYQGAWPTMGGVQGYGAQQGYGGGQPSWSVGQPSSGLGGGSVGKAWGY